MCINLQKPLNPKAQEWRPSSTQPQQPYQFLPSQPLSAPPPPVAEKFFFQLPQIPQPYYYSDQFPQYHHHQGFVPYTPYTVHQYPFQQYVLFPAINECFYQPEKPSDVAEASVEDGMRKPSERKLGAVRRVFPPRLRRASTCFDGKKMPQPPPAKRKVWKPKGKSPTAKLSPLKSSPPLPRLRDEFYHPSNTTVMMKNIPNQIRRDFMLEFLDGCCKSYSLEYDFLYLPMDFRSKDNLGYAFVNFTSGGDALKFKRILHNYKWGSISIDGELISSKKVCEITWARIQGKESLIRRFKSSNFICEKLEFLPVVLDPPRNGSDLNPSTPVIIGTMRPTFGKRIN